MSNKKSAVGLFVFLCLLATGGFGQTSLILTDNGTEYDFFERIYVVRDPTNEKGLSDVLPLLYGAEPQHTTEPNFGFTADTIWGLVRITNNSKQTDYLLYLDYNLDFVTVNYFEKDAPRTIKELHSGALTAYSQRPYRHRFPVIPLSLEQGKTYDIVMAIKSSGNTGIPIYLYTPASFAGYNEKMGLYFGLMFGILIGLILYILFLIISARATTYIFYLLFAFFHLLFQLTYNGLSGLYLLPENPLLVKITLDFSCAGTLIAGTIFAQAFLQTRKNAPLFHKAFIVMIAVASLAFPFALVGWHRQSIGVTNALISVSAILISICGIKVYLAGYKSARFFILAYISLIISAIISSLKIFGALPSNFFTTQSILFGSVIESILLSLAIADRINSLRYENKEYQLQLLESRENEIKILREKFYNDSMTGLFNRNRLIMDMQKTETCSLFIVNIDQFRQINDLYGTVIGNQVIIEMANRIKENNLSHPNVVYRLHADEFAVVISGELPTLELLRIAEQLHLVCQERAYIIDLYIIPISVTIGIASGASNILGKADIALSHARDMHKEYMAYSPDFDTSKQIQSNLECIQLVRYALDMNTVFPVFQPILDNKSNTIEKYETLMRIRDNEGNSLLPGQFLNVAKKSKLYPKLSQRLIKKGIQYFSGLPNEFSINISVNDILDTQSMAVVWECVAAHPHKECIIFELLESESIEAYDPVAKFIEEARKQGCKIAIDDFGSGYSNFEHILKLNVDYLKIDASLIRDIHTDANARMVVETIAQFARRLKIKTIAEFVHCEEVFNLVRYLGINFSQGAFIGMPKETLIEAKPF